MCPPFFPIYSFYVRLCVCVCVCIYIYIFFIYLFIYFLLFEHASWPVSSTSWLGIEPVIPCICRADSLPLVHQGSSSSLTSWLLGFPSKQKHVNRLRDIYNHILYLFSATLSKNSRENTGVWNQNTLPSMGLLILYIHMPFSSPPWLQSLFKAQTTPNTIPWLSSKEC